ncbi:MAG: encapsulin-associated ferritin-like protein [Alphaproteobacteria bacterium]
MSGEIHEERSKLSTKTLDVHRAINSLMEELEAVDWYNQRADVASDPELKALLEHNRDEEKEHAAMLVEWLRRNDEGFGNELKSYLFKTGSIIHHEAVATSEEQVSDENSSLGLGKL